MKYYIIIFLSLLTYCAPTLELYTFPVTTKSRVIDKSIGSLNWIDDPKIKVLKVRRNGKDILKLTGNFTFTEKDTVYILGKSTNKSYIKLFFE